MKALIKLFSVFALLMSVSQAANALEPVYSDFFGKAIKGYDPVAYFTQGKPVKGDADFVYEWNDAKWYFASKQHLEAFMSNPEKYAPQYGGYCAWAVSNGYTAKIDLNAWRIVDDKLYLNYNKSVQEKWQQDIAGNVAKADKNWPSLLAE
ncbi:YHS domain-containing (seleno)protein [Vibrio agarivorans]|uniref:YHS domain-containing (Seleno)protein n=1 Tax=Vibrio agarivorans TaxID=153622 RepID=A0ABT7Y442_9VIBR|nr:YHS domain-containing (seleno)protein [Vibrio agarivorans]MDN2482814.1 YHS domain-containing (seleno)protein [Vibrio agarivorans]